jgi:2-dehydropantoate 2-reductase
VGKRRAERFEPAEVYTSPDEVARAPRFDRAWLCVATTSLDPAWLADVAAATAPATLVSFQPGLGVREKLEQAAPRDRIVQGVIAFLAWSTPLEGSTDPRELAAADAPGVAYFCPPMTPIAISGASERRALGVLDALRLGGMPAQVVHDAEADLAFSTALLMPVIAGLEIAGWSFAAFREGDAADLATAAASETLAITEEETGRAAPLPSRLLLLPQLLRVGTRLAPVASPLDIETYLRVHFTKVGEQTRLLLSGYGERAARRDREHGAIERITRALEDLPV